MLSRGRLNQREDPCAARRALGKTFVQALMTNFERFSVRRLTRLRRQRPHLYFQLVTALLPKEYRIKEVDFSDIADQELQQMLDMLKAAIREKRSKKREAQRGIRADAYSLRRRCFLYSQNRPYASPD